MRGEGDLDLEDRNRVITSVRTDRMSQHGYQGKELLVVCCGNDDTDGRKYRIRNTLLVIRGLDISIYWTARKYIYVTCFMYLC